MTMDGRKALAAAACAPLFLLFPLEPPWSWAFVALGAVWAPGYALLDMAYPRGRCVGLERHALAAGLGLLLLPVLALATSATLGFHRWSLVLAIMVVVAVAAIVAAARKGRLGAEPAGFAVAPSTRSTLALCGATFLLAGVVAWWPQPGAELPAALWLEGPDGQALVLPAVVAVNATVPVTVLLASGDAALEGTLRLAWDGHGEATAIRLAPHGRHAVAFVVPTDAPGLHAFDARLEAAGMAREVHFVLQVGSA
ncbi:MAG: hypothetical protein QOD77_1769 [Thermoplasmata archaeon]|jgi:hypothetical protein|nr:hypothetical protein [Thermoplasmata archaeon]